MCDTMIESYTVLRSPSTSLISYRSDESCDPPPEIKDILNMATTGDPEYGVEPVTIEVITAGDKVLDIIFNDRSIGYFAVKTFCEKVNKNLALAEVAARGTYDEVASYLSRSDAAFYTLPTFGDMEC